MKCPLIEFKCNRECNQFVKKREMKNHSCLKVLKKTIDDQDKTISE
jgi:hypothetical protein